jgi:hypothetical protein
MPACAAIQLIEPKLMIEPCRAAIMPGATA